MRGWKFARLMVWLGLILIGGVSETEAAITQTGRFQVDLNDRAAVSALYQAIYLTALETPPGWTGDLGTCDPGRTSAEYDVATLAMVNFFRALAGLPSDVGFDPDLDAKCRLAALMMIAEGKISHQPPPDWACYSAAGAEAAAHANLAIGEHGPAAIVGYMRDGGAGNEAVGHRRWLLYPPQRTMGAGSTAATHDLFHGSNALWIMGEFGPRASGPEWVAWPPQGYVPWELVFERWSFSIHQADFSAARVSMSRNGEIIQLTQLAPQSGYGDNTLVWEPALGADSETGREAIYQVRIENVRQGGQARSYEYEVRAFDPKTAQARTAAAGWWAY